MIKKERKLVKYSRRICSFILSEFCRCFII